MYTSNVRWPGSVEAVAAWDGKEPITACEDEEGLWWVSSKTEKIRAHSLGEAARYTHQWAKRGICPLPRESRRPA